jgi:hypothetical protein
VLFRRNQIAKNILQLMLARFSGELQIRHQAA